MDLGLEFQKTNIKIRINIFEILSVYVQLCQISGKKKQFLLFQPKFAQKWI